MRQINNPILSGFYPDPSVCRVGGDFYLVASSFELFPGLPVFHSRDLANWEQIGYAMNRPSQLKVLANTVTGGVMAPTIRHHDGTFYIINCNANDRGNYIITAADPAGPWSEPHWLDDVPGIDASLFFDNDGTCYVMGTGSVVPRADGSRDRGIWVAEYDIEAFRVTGEPWTVWDSALRVASSPEAPHLYHIGDWYYLLIAEGGTEHFHACTIARSHDLRSFFQGYEANPILTHRHLGFSYPIDNIGHGDLVDTPDGNWYMVCLGSRQIEGCHKNLGRETYITPVVWERGWPVCAPETGKVEWRYPADPALPWTPVEPEPGFDDFDGNALALPWNFWGTPTRPFHRVADSQLQLPLLPRPMARKLKPASFFRERVSGDDIAVVLRRQRHVHFTITAQLEFTANGQNEAAGIVMMQASNHQFRLERGMDEKGGQVVRFVKVTTELNGAPHMPGFDSKTTEEVVAVAPVDGGSCVLRIVERGQDTSFYYGPDAASLRRLYAHADAGDLNPEIVGGMVGTLLGMFATANGQESDNVAAFDYFSYEGSDE